MSIRLLLTKNHACSLRRSRKECHTLTDIKPRLFLQVEPKGVSHSYGLKPRLFLLLPIAKYAVSRLNGSRSPGR